MKALMIKDILTLWKAQKRLFLVIFVVGGFICAAQDASFALIYMAILGAMAGLTSLNYDDHENGMSFLLTLPFSRTVYVREKYIYSLIMGLVSVTFGIIIHIISGTLIRNSITPDNITDVLMTAGISLVMLVFSISLMIPIRLQFGAEKIMVAYMLIFFIAFGTGAVIPRLVERLTGIDVKTTVIQVFDNAGPGKSFFVIGIFVCVMLVVSEQISELIMKKKEY